MNKRFQKWLNYNDLNSNKLAENINVSRATISHIISGRNKPSVDFLHKILNKYPDLNLNWLVTGNGSMKFDNNIKKRIVDKVVVFYEDSSYQELVN
ncbi:MAG: helix-turn-helix transcriptional regulator [Pelagibacterales bacterium]|nr:helix-turn-helix transcriptional regulator [Pelagibacterales bacterium]